MLQACGRLARAEETFGREQAGYAPARLAVHNLSCARRGAWAMALAADSSADPDAHVHVSYKRAISVEQKHLWLHAQRAHRPRFPRAHPP